MQKELGSIQIIVASEANDLIFYLRSSFFMMYPQGPQLYTQWFPELAGGGGGGVFVGWRFRGVEIS